MALILAWPLLFPIFAFLESFSSSSASPESNVFHSDIEGSSAVGSQEDSLIRGQQQSVTFRSWSPFTERCQEGFFQTFSGECRPCHCNNNAYKCLDGSGVCLDCQRNTTGDHCDRCPEGYLGDVTRGAPSYCQPCPCPLPQIANFAVSCYRKNGVVRCKCKENYAGPNCERCAPGYYGNPLLIGSSCKKCDCSGNSDPNLIFEDCDEVTGQCRNCLRNTTGFNCELCAPGYYGDARIAKTCTACNCRGGPCDHRTGQCLAEPPVPPPATDCPVISCDKCIWDLTNDLGLAAQSIDESKATLQSISTGAAAHRHLQDLNSTTFFLKKKLSEKDSHSVLRKSQTDNAANEMTELLKEINALDKKKNQESSRGLLVQKETMETTDRATILVEALENMMDNIQEISSKVEYYSIEHDLKPEDITQKLKAAEEMLKDIRQRKPFTIQMQLAGTESDEAKELLEKAEKWQQTHNETRSLIPDILDQLGEHNAKVADLLEALDQAADYIRKAEVINKENTAKLQEQENQHEILEEQINKVNSTLLIARDILSVPYQIYYEMNEAIQNASGFYAEIDGAKIHLQDKLANLSRFDDVIVQKATDYAQELRILADDLKRSLHGVDTNGLVQKAINASNVHENILNYIHEASQMAALALNTTERVSDAVVGIGTQIVYHKEESQKLLQQAKEQQQTAPANDLAVANTGQHANETLARKNNFKAHLMKVVTQIQMPEQDNAKKRLEELKVIADQALNTAAVVNQTTDPMMKNLTKWSQDLKTFEPEKAAYERATITARDTVRSLTEVVPRLLDKLRTVEQKQPANNVSASIQRIRELIAQTRSVANKVQVSMSFEGQSAVEVHPQTNMEDLKAFTSLSLYMMLHKGSAQQAIPQDQFILYLGSKNTKNYLGLAIKNDNLVYIYNLGSGDVEIPLDSKPVSSWPAYFSLVKIERIGKHGKVFLTVPSLSSTAEEKFIKKGEVPGDGSLLNLEPKNTVFYVGGVPHDFKLPSSLNLPGFIGCLELATLNDDVISLYNFKNIYNVTRSVPCARDKLAFTQSRAVNYFFDGSGYALLRHIERRGKFGLVTRFDIEVRTPTDNGLLLLMFNGTMFFSLEMQNGYLYLQYDFGFANGPVILEDSLKKAVINDARFHEISVIYHNSKKMILVVDRRHIKSVENEKKNMPFTDVYIGGAPTEILKSSGIGSHLAISTNFRGCMKGFQFQKKDFNLLEEPGTLGIGYGCPEESLMSRKAYFNGESYISSSQKIPLFHGFEGGFNFRTLQPNGLLFYCAEGSDVFSISMDQGTVVLNAKGVKVQTADKSYNDGKSHFVITSVSPERLMLLVDEKKQFTDNLAKNGVGEKTMDGKKFYFGGSPINTGFANFTGCISNAYFTRLDRDVEVEDFQRYPEKIQVSLYGCPVETPPAALLHKKRKNSSKSKESYNKRNEKDSEGLSQFSLNLNKMNQELRVQRDPHCLLSNSPKATEHTYLFGGTANSRQEFDYLPKDFNERSQFSITLKTQSSHGMIFYVSDQEEDNFMALFIAHGRLIFIFNSGQQKLRIRTQEKYNDDQWHNVMFVREKNAGRLVIDGLRVLQNSLSSFDNTWHVVSPFYIGGVAPGKAAKNIQINSVYSFSGCLGSLLLNGRPVTSPSQTFSVTPCFEGPSEEGTYFSSEGGYIILDESFSLGLKFEVVFEIRPRRSSGILMHAHSVNGEFLNIHMKEGQVIVKLNNGIKDFSTLVMPKQNICDGRWHRIAVIRDANVVQLDVDSEVNHVVGPLNPRSVDHREPVFVGGVPESLLTFSLTTRNSFAGCIRNFMIDERRVSFSKAALVSGAVSINICPAA
ncbi:laminin subunit alpha-4 [Varanus komodoensis]|uniref:Laminin subunit alpha-4 n=1 Tax=Varanus komodoensis TaxID=61221 RepID=A0A8D2JBS0_VARKO|nr:laminin subunit alpha-4 [Varanus komodoensis]